MSWGILIKQVGLLVELKSAMKLRKRIVTKKKHQRLLVKLLCHFNVNNFQKLKHFRLF